jgi:prepilin-type N-terminal cleavage/methylation domain-containing protein
MFKLKKKDKNIFPKASNDQGFTIIETLVAIFILLISITGPMVFSQNGLRAAFQSRDQITAFYLAQDAIEYVKNIRDHNVLDRNVNWLDGLQECEADGIGDYGCTIDTTIDLDGAVECTGADTGSDPGCLGSSDEGDKDNKLRIDENGLFSIDPADPQSIFARNVYIRNISSTEAEIVVKVRWTSHDTIGVRDIVVVEYIRDWASELGL